MKNNTLVLLSVVLAGTVLTFHAYAKKQPSGDEKNMFEAMSRPMQWVGKTAPNLSAEFLDGEKFTLADDIGKKVIVLNFFATWCGPCKEELPEFVRYFEKRRGGPFLMIGIDADEPETTVRDFVREQGMTYPVAIDRGGRLQKLFSVRAFPTTVLIGADGIVHVYEVGEIRNADVAFDAYFTTGAQSIASGTAVTREAYLATLSTAGTGTTAGEQAPSDPEEPPLTGRAKTIADKMNCPCGCTHTLQECTCKTAKDIKEQLRKRDFTAQSDAEVIQSLNREYCMK